jgi:hypothetical protein
MKTVRLLSLFAALAVCGCANVSTQVVELRSTQHYAPSQDVEILLEKPKRAYVELALLESNGFSEPEMLLDAREKAKAIGADAIVKLETQTLYHPPVPIYDPWIDPFYAGYYRRWGPFAPYDSAFGPYRYVGGGYSYVLRSVAIKYTG